MPGLTYGEKVNKEVLTYINTDDTLSFSIAELPFITNGAGDRSQATLIDCTCLNGVSAKAKNIRIQAASNANLTIVFDVWFANSRDELEVAVANGDPAQLIAWNGVLDSTFPVSTEWFAIDYDRDLTGSQINDGSISMIITIT
jgi:hypothetical protein